MSLALRSIGIALIISIVARPALSQWTADTLGTLPEIRVEATRAVELEGAAPIALTILQPADFRTSAANSLQDLAAQVPGLWLADRGHFALGERIVIRGVGARSPFGARGIQIHYDGIPLTMPDGQAITDIVDPYMVRRVEVVRGPTAVYWGNASGGAIAFSTEATDETTFRIATGSFGRRYFGARTSIGETARSGNLFVSHTMLDGYRENSQGTMTRGGFTGRTALSDRTSLGLITVGALQDVLSPGSLTPAEYAADPTAANPSYITTVSGKWSRHLQGGVTLDHKTGGGRVSVLTYGVLRDLENPLPFAFVEVGRLAGGARATFSQRVGGGEMTAGLDIAHQADDRRNFVNSQGERSGNPTLDQQENVTAVGATAFYRFSPLSRLQATLGARLDRINYTLTDRMPRLEPRSGARTFSAISPSLSIAYLLDGGQLYASASSSFETPTTTELVNNPDMQPGFNAVLNPERMISTEIGVRRSGGALTLDANLFLAGIEGRISSFRTEAGGDRDFFRNAPRGTHYGAEFSAGLALPADIRAQASYAGLNAASGDDGNLRLPAVPPHQFSARLAWSPGPLRAGVHLESASGYFADDANQHRISGFTVLDLHAGLDRLPVGGAWVSPYARIGNILDAGYVRSVVVNASFARYYEPAPGRTLEIGLTLDL
jgi:iron complex outermembrane recepter protein